MDAEVELHAVFQGKVQGVGFRWQVVHHANACGLKGTVKNLLNGSVEVMAQGAKENLEKFLVAIQKEPGHARIDKVQIQYQNPKEFFKDFKILR